jgi:hypothetical protein
MRCGGSTIDEYEASAYGALGVTGAVKAVLADVASAWWAWTRPTRRHATVLDDTDGTRIGCRQRDRFSRTRSNNRSERRTSPGPCSSPPAIT